MLCIKGGNVDVQIVSLHENSMNYKKTQILIFFPNILILILKMLLIVDLNYMNLQKNVKK